MYGFFIRTPQKLKMLFLYYTIRRAIEWEEERVKKKSRVQSNPNVENTRSLGYLQINYIIPTIVVRYIK